jgi:membrane protease YdiL (CAAX protease family)
MTLRWWSVAIVVLMDIPLFWAIAYLMPPATTLAAMAQYFAASLVSVALVMVPYGRAAFGLLGCRPASLRFVLAGTAGAVVVTIAVSPIGLESEWVQELIEIVREPGQLLASLVVIGGLAPLAEELAFRGLLYGWLETRWGPRVAVVGSALAFAVSHWEPAHMAVALPAGLFLGLLRWRSRSLLPPLIAHAANNCSFVLIEKYFDVL